ncbi:baseplate assembly protein [Marinagarivorans algicola]|uniref:baseplate assembly protein n=1 Tax=Marinagarivorans algicola TaxID=1513270 RepID=UPI0006B50489|nr:baseplate J/gp47 family protein [Marinagarivorans algicola]
MTSVIDLSQLPPPDIVERLDYEEALARWKNEFFELNPEYSAMVESDPAFKQLEVGAFVEVGIRKRINDAAKATMLAFSRGHDLDHLTAFAGVERLVIKPADLNAIPPQQAVLESDAAMLRRYQLAWDALSVAGPDGAYEFFARTAHAGVKDASVQSISAGEVIVTLLALDDDGIASQEILTAVEQVLSHEGVRPLTDSVIVQTAEVVRYRIAAKIYVLPGPDNTVVLEASQAAAAEYAVQKNKLDQDITLSGVLSALHQPGVQRVELIEPAQLLDPAVQSLKISKSQAPLCTAIDVSFGGRAD